MSTTTPTTPTSEKAEMPVTFARLRSGEWGIRGPEGAIVAGELATVTRRNGTTCIVAVDRIIWRGDGVALAAIAEIARCWHCSAPGPEGRRCKHCRDGHHHRW